MSTSHYSKKTQLVNIPICSTVPGTPAWRAHLAELEELKRKAELLGLSSLALSLTCELAEHESFEWRCKRHLLEGGT